MAKEAFFLNIAKKIAETSTYGRFRHGAVLVKGGTVRSLSCNINKYNRFADRFRPPKEGGRGTIHAEVGCILGIDKSVTRGASIYLARINYQGEQRYSLPCAMCQNVLSHLGVKKVMYTQPNTGFSTLIL